MRLTRGYIDRLMEKRNQTRRERCYPQQPLKTAPRTRCNVCKEKSIYAKTIKVSLKPI